MIRHPLQPGWLRYACAVVSVGVAVWVRLLLDPIVGDQFPYATFLFAILLTAWYGGAGPALIAVILGAAASDYFLIPPREHLALVSIDQQIGMLLYASTGLAMAGLGAAMHEARKRAEAAAQDAQQQLTLAMERAPLGAWVRDAHTGRTQYSPGWYGLFGYGTGMFDADSAGCAQLVHPDDRARVREAFRAFQQRPVGTYEAEFRLRHADGSYRWVLSRATAVCDAAGNLQRLAGAHLDITDRKHAEIALHESEQRFRVLVENIEEAIYVGIDLRFAYVNPAAVRLFGAETPDQLLGQPILDRLHPDFREQALQRTRLLREEKRVPVFEPVYLRLDGTPVPVAASAAPIMLGGRRGAVVFARDITARRRAEAALRQSEEHFRALVEQSLDLVAIVEPDGTYRYASPSHLAASGYRPDELVGQNGFDFLHPDDRAAVAQRLAEALARGEETGTMEYRFRHKDGSWRHVEAAARNLLHDVGVRGLLVSARDITERKHAEEQLAIQHAALTAAANAIVITDPDGTIVWANPAFTGLTGYALDEVIGQNPRLLKSGAQERSFYTGLWGTICAGRVWSGQLVNRRKDGTLYREEMTITPVQQAGAITHFIAIKQDVTERQRAEEAIRKLNEELEERVRARTAEIEAANRELESFSYSVSHDLRAPLRAMDGFAKALIEDFGDQLPAQGQRYAHTIRNGAQRMGALIEDLLTLSRLGRQPLTKQRVDTAALVRAVFDELSSQCDGRQIELRIGELAACYGDPTLLKQVWVNLLSNALKYTRKREQAVVEVGCSQEGGATVYFVRDNGAGFDMQYADKLFGVFQRLHSVGEFEGTGVGLAIVQRVVRRHGGRVWAEAAVGCGATFYFTLDESAEPA